MTQTQRKQPQPKIDFAPHQIYVKRPGCDNPVQTLIAEVPGWSFCQWEYTNHIGLYYKGRYIATLAPCYGGEAYKERDGGDAAPVFASLADAALHYTYERRLSWVDEVNRQEGLEEWCIPTGFTPTKLTLRLMLPPQERKRLERLARIKGESIEQMTMQAIYAFLPELESFYKDYETLFDEDEAEEARG